MKTALEQFIEKLTNFKEDLKEKYDGDPLVTRGISIAIHEAKLLLKAEKEQIWMAFNDGKVSSIVRNQRTPEQYFNLTFKSDEFREATIAECIKPLEKCTYCEHYGNQDCDNCDFGRDKIKNKVK